MHFMLNWIKGTKKCTRKELMNQIGMVLIKFLISFLADAYVMQSLILAGALFHALIPSLIKVFLESSEKLCVGRTSLVIDLIDLTLGPDSFFTRLNGWSPSFTAFHISDSLIWAFIWLTDNMLNLSSSEAVLILLLILELFSRRSILFWDICRSFISLVEVSVSFHLICPHICKPYLILELNRLSATFLSI